MYRYSTNRQSQVLNWKFSLLTLLRVIAEVVIPIDIALFIWQNCEPFDPDLLLPVLRRGRENGLFPVQLCRLWGLVLTKALLKFSFSFLTCLLQDVGHRFATLLLYYPKINFDITDFLQRSADQWMCVIQSLLKCSLSVDSSEVREQMASQRWRNKTDRSGGTMSIWFENNVPVFEHFRELCLIHLEMKRGVVFLQHLLTKWQHHTVGNGNKKRGWSEWMGRWLELNLGLSWKKAY